MQEIKNNLNKTISYGFISPKRTTFNELIELFIFAQNTSQKNLARSWIMLRSQLEGRLKFHFGEIYVDEIDYPKICQFVDHSRLNNLKDVTINQYFNTLRKILKYALQNELILKIPTFPKLNKDSVPRGAFSLDEYKKIIRYVKKIGVYHTLYPIENSSYIKNKKFGLYASKNPIPYDLYLLIRFMVNSFLRPVDIKFIKHKHITVIKGKHSYLRLSIPSSKKHSGKVITLPACVHIYEVLNKYLDKQGFTKPDDYIFFPAVKDRFVVGEIITKQFRKVLTDLNLRLGPEGQSRTIYSLRHTAITFRLLFGQGIDLLTLAKNSRTSVEMIEKFYASQLDPEMNVAMLHSRRC